MGGAEPGLQVGGADPKLDLKADLQADLKMDEMNFEELEKIVGSENRFKAEDVPIKMQGKPVGEITKQGEPEEKTVITTVVGIVGDSAEEKAATAKEANEANEAKEAKEAKGAKGAKGA